MTDDEQATIDLNDRFMQIATIMIAGTGPTDWATGLAEIGYEHDDPTDHALSMAAAVLDSILGVVCIHGATHHGCDLTPPQILSSWATQIELQRSRG